MSLSWKQRGARILGSFVLGFCGGLGALSSNIQTESFLIVLGQSCISGLITSAPQIKRVLDGYGR